MRVASLHLYPVKSGRVVDVKEAALLPAGFAGDRRWMIVDEAGRFLTQREEPRLALLAATLRPNGLTLSAPGAGTLALDVPGEDAPTVMATVWKDTVPARLAEAASGWLSGWLGRSLRLVWLPERANRRLPAAWVPWGGEVGFADGYPILIVNTASLADLNRRLAHPAPMARFRPSLVIESDEPWGEDSWLTLRIGAVELELVKPCTRCIITTTDQETAERSSQEPLRTLQRCRRSADARVSGALFGWNAVPRVPGPVRVGDPVEVLERRAEPWPIRPAV